MLRKFWLLFLALGSAGCDAQPAAQAAVPVLDGDTPETLAARVLEAEHHLYPHALALVASGAVSIQGERVIDGNDQAQVALFSPPVP